MRNFLLLLISLITLQLSAQKIQGDWYGTLDAMGTKLPLIIHVSGPDDGLKGSMDSPSQGAYGIEMSNLLLIGNQFTFSVPAIQGSYKGTLSERGLAGDWTQAGFDFPLELDHTPPVASGRKMREQEPRDFPYERLAVSFPGGADGVSMAGELTYPADGKIKRALVLVSGSGGQDRNSELGEAINHRPFLVLSDYLTRQGIAVLRYDDRGIGASTGNFADATSRDFAEDASAAVEFLANHKLTKKAKVGLAGHSEGGMIGQIVAAENEELDFLVMIAAPGVPTDTLMMEQSRLVQQSMGAPPQLVERNLKPLRKAYYTIRQHPELSDKILKDSLVEVFKASISDLPEPLQRSISDKDAFARQQVGTLANPWFRYFISYDPQPYLEQIKIPVLAMNGELDMQVPAELNLSGIARGMNQEEELRDFTTVSLPGLNHLMQTATTGAPHEYGTIEETFSPMAMRIMADWINKQ
ncbi:alpha/beta hydrolase [Lewinellaceae bacterium SD302]|nr:alpha/beta hydrolase [Lewinellaceae bacterium SD302]